MKTHLFTLLIAISSFVCHSQNVDILLRQKIPMRDGINLSADIYLPEDNSQPLPVILSYTPYLNDMSVKRGMFFAKEGYIFVSLDLRGRGNSEGEFFPFEKDGQDGFDAINWIADQPWSNGEVGMMGGSYLGMVQWMTLKEMPEALKTITPTAPVGPGIDFPKSNGSFNNYTLQWLSYTDGKGLNSNMFGNGDYWQRKAKKKIAEGLAFKDWDKIVFGERNPIFQKWITHPDFDEYWQSFYPLPKHYNRIDIPILTITGYYDADQPGALKYYEDHMKYGNQDGKNEHYLVFGPWSHRGTRRPVSDLWGLKFDDSSKLDMLQLHLEWFNWIFKDGDKPKILKNRINHFVMERDEWDHSEDFYSLANDSLTFFLSSPETPAVSLYNAGQLISTKPGKEMPDHYIFNPLDTTTQTTAKNDFLIRPIPSVLKNSLIYVSNPLQEEIELIGQIELGAYISLNVKDTDIKVSYYEIRETGKTIYLGNDIVRARYRNSLEKSKLVKPGEIELYTFNTTYFTNIKLLKSSRIALLIGPSDGISNQRNYHSGKDVSEETKADAVTAKVSLHHSKKYPSYLKLPVRRE